MNRSQRTFNLAAYLAMLAAVPTLTQCTSSSNKAGGGGSLAEPAGASVYVQTTQGVNAYSAAADGPLTLMSGSPFTTKGAMAASNGSNLITLDANLIYSYPVESNGAIGSMASQISTQGYSGSQCGNNTFGSAVFDRTGENLYAMLVSSNQCLAQQTFNVAQGSGTLSFGGAVMDTDFPADALSDNDCCTPLTMTGDDVFGYTVSQAGVFWNGTLIGYRRGSDGTLQQISINETDPTPQPGQGFTYIPPFAVEADSTGHLAALLQGEINGAYVMQLASYTVDTQGNVASTNTWQNMPTVTTWANGIGTTFNGVLSMSPSGNLLAVELVPQCQNCNTPWGFQLFHFNGADPITPYGSALLPNLIVGQMAWDTNNHLYVLGGVQGSSSSGVELHVFTVTPTSIEEAAGSPYAITNGGNSMVVVSR